MVPFYGVSRLPSNYRCHTGLEPLGPQDLEEKLTEVRAVLFT